MPQGVFASVLSLGLFPQQLLEGSAQALAAAAAPAATAAAAALLPADECREVRGATQLLLVLPLLTQEGGGLTQEERRAHGVGDAIRVFEPGSKTKLKLSVTQPLI